MEVSEHHQVTLMQENSLSPQVITKPQVYLWEIVELPSMEQPAKGPPELDSNIVFEGNDI